jgi:hypothetical protein
VRPRARRFRLRHFSNAASIPRSTASSGMPAFFHVSISAQSSGESRNSPVPRALLKMFLDFGEVVEIRIQKSGVRSQNGDPDSDSDS